LLRTSGKIDQEGVTKSVETWGLPPLPKNRQGWDSRISNALCCPGCPQNPEGAARLAWPSSHASSITLELAFDGDPASHGLVPRPASSGPDRISCLAKLDADACAAFSEESRMKIFCAANTNRKSGDGRHQSAYCYFLGGAMVSLAALATRNLTTVLALILMVSPV
jgi:hypothetical protein